MAGLVFLLQDMLAQTDPLLPVETKRILLKEVLQTYVLDYLYNHPDYRRLNFYGGTCLHVIYRLNRLSEDIDLDNSGCVPLDTLSADLANLFHHTYGYEQVAVKQQTGENGIIRFTLKFPVLRELGLATDPSLNLHLKVEISQHPQVCVIHKTPVFQHGRSFVPAHFSLETMMAGKMLACLERNFQFGAGQTDIKARDFYDLVWFMQRNVSPLEEKLAKDGKQAYTTASAMQQLEQKILTIRLADLRRDLYPLFEQRSYIEAWVDSFQENFTRLVQNYL